MAKGKGPQGRPEVPSPESTVEWAAELSKGRRVREGGYLQRGLGVQWSLLHVDKLNFKL